MFDLTHHPSWDMFFNDETIEMLNHIYGQLSNFYPAEENVLRFAKTNLDNVKCVIIGMDPYPSWNSRDNRPQATGRAFEVSELAGKTWDYPIKQASLRNILRALYYNETGFVSPIAEIRKDIRAGDFKISLPDEWFDKTEKQGVLWLNSTLTVEPDHPGSHKKIWAGFRKPLFSYIAMHNIPFMLWGNNAVDEVGSLIPLEKVIINENMFSVFRLQYHAPHPRTEEFVRNNTFWQINGISWIC